MSLRKTRLLKELAHLENDFNHEGIKFEFDGNSESIEILKFEFIAPEGTPFAKETLQLEMKLTSRYPLEPPILRFTTPVRHPNIDEVSGRICLDLLRMPPEGSWRPNVGLGSVLVSIYVLLGSPNLDDPVRPDLISEWLPPTKEKENADAEETQHTETNRTKRNFSLSLSALRKKPKTEESHE